MIELTTGIHESKVIIPEGKAEWALLQSLLEIHEISGVQVVKYRDGGNDTFRDRFEALQPFIISGEIETVTLVADNEDYPSETFRNIQDQLRNVSGLDLNIPSKAWECEEGEVYLGIVTLPEDGREGTVETLIWRALEEEYPDETSEAESFISRMPTGQSDQNLTTREKARFSSVIAATCENDPSCMVQWMWQPNKNYRHLLHRDVFSELIEFIRDL